MSTVDISDLGKRPIEGGDTPAGSDVRDEPAFEKLEAEIAKLTSAINSPLVDWKVINQLCTELLSDKGKDLLVACYLAAGLLETRSLAGLSDGLKVIADMLETYWDTMYPSVKRMRGRRNALQWLIDRVQQRATETGWTELPPIEAGIPDALQGSLAAIDAVLVDKDSDAPSIRSLITLVRSVPVVEEAPAPLPAAEPLPAGGTVAGNSPSPALAASTVAAAAPDSGEQAEQALDDLCARLAPIGEWLLNADLTNPLPYRLDRLAAWTPINTLPGADAGGETHIPGPISQVVDALEKLKVTQADADLVRLAETQLAAFPFWLDLNCICATALQRLGSAYEAAHREVCGETARLVARLSGIEKLAFAGGMPFANGDTLAWLGSLASASGNAQPSASAAERNAAIAVAVGNARAMAATDDLVGAVNALQQQLLATDHPKDRLYLQIRLCELLLLQRPGAALDAFALSIVDTIDKHLLTAWEPVLALDGLQVAYKVMTRNDEGKAVADGLLQRVVALDSAAAVKLVT
ncbi:MAG: type VI secretion system protein TssA [Pseudomonadota bacterium]